MYHFYQQECKKLSLNESFYGRNLNSLIPESHDIVIKGKDHERDKENDTDLISDC